ncbi:MAG: hypothetical protein GQ570_08420 [Helicobacteraceae bacterium]|nr:hypothetical protein [Helicobacteraceae bacterium]
MNNTLDELKRFQTDRGLHLKPFDKRVCTMNIMEEIFEMYGVQDNKARFLANRFVTIIEETVEGIIDNVHLELEVAKDVTYSKPTDEDVIDALCDIQVFAGGDVLKVGYDNEKCLAEVAKEINSREGTIIEGKFQKDKTPEAMAKWLKADFTNCKL